MNFVLQIESEIYDLMEDLTSTPDQGSAYENMYWAARGMCRVLCQFTQDSDECDMFDRIQQSVLQQLANDTANKADDDREEVAAEVTAHVETVVVNGAAAMTAATLEELFGGAKSPVDCKPDIPVKPDPVMEMQSGDIFF